MRLFAMCNVFFKGILLVCPHSYFELIISSCILKGKDIAENQRPLCANANSINENTLHKVVMDNSNNYYYHSGLINDFIL